MAAKRKSVGKKAQKSVEKAVQGAPAWGQLSEAERRRVAARMLRTYVGLVKFGAGRYNVVSGSHTRLRERAGIEHGGEDDALTTALRDQFINLGRNAVRNNETLNGILEQFRLNGIGIEGGKAYFDFPDEYEAGARKLKRAFSHWCSSCEFFDDLSLRDTLGIVLQTLLVCGECALVFDDGRIDGSGRVLVFEPDSIINYPKDLFAKRFPAYTQYKGKIRTKSGVLVGITVSSSERGKDEAEDPDHLLFFTKEPHENPLDVDWMLLGPRWRSNQGSSTPPIAAPLASLMDTADLLGFEKEAAKHNSQMYAQLVQTGTDNSAADEILGDPSLTAGAGDMSGDSGDDLAAAAVEAQDIQPEAVSFQELERCGAFYDIMPENAKLELMDTKHPNPNMNEFIRQVECRGGWSLGLCKCFVTGEVDSSFSGYRGMMLMTWPVFQKWQKILERACDWVFRCWWRFYVEKLGVVKFGPGELPEDFLDRVRWFWPRMREVNPVDMQNAYNSGLKNGTIGIDEIIGPDWKEKLRERAAQKRFFEENGLLHPASETVSGQIVGEVADGKANE